MRDTLEFYVQYADGDELWMWIYMTVKPMKHILKLALSFGSVYTPWHRRCQNVSEQGHQGAYYRLHTGYSINVDLRAISWYNGLGKGFRCKVTEWANNQQAKVKVWCDCLKLWNHECVLC